MPDSYKYLRRIICAALSASAVMTSPVLSYATCPPIVLEQTLDNRVQKEKRRIVNSQKRDLEASLSRLTIYEDYFRSASLTTGVDVHLLKAIAVKESGGNPLLVSPAGAAGIMQLMPLTAKEYGLNRDDFVDERFSPRSIAAAASYVRYLIDRYEDTVLAVLAYHNGETNMDRILRKDPSRFPKEIDMTTKDFAYKVLAMTSILHNMEEHGLSVEHQPLHSVQLSKSIIHTVGFGQDLQKIALIHNISGNDIKALNPQILNYAPGMRIYVPSG